MSFNRSALYNPEISGPFVNSSNVVERNPSLNPTNPLEIKLTPIGLSPTGVEGSQVMSSSQERDQNSSSANVRAH